ncbi:helix-turn-helix domain-containing protein [Actinoplanes sp. NPDC051513]|uniref:helix-turn-helix domain-containing protein n=1 Tax=Actinoplanes sp. NPDC051513 TaxID=3363908 RepID=UPI0037B4986F
MLRDVMTPMPPMSSPPPSELDGLAQLRVQLQQLHGRAGAPSTRAIAGRAAQPISHTTVATVLKCAKPPRWAQLELVVQALNGDVELFRTAWMAMRNESSAPPEPPGEQGELEQLQAEVAKLRQERDELAARVLRQPRPSLPQLEWRGIDAFHPTVLRIILGDHLRRLREAKRITHENAGWEIRSSASKVMRLELGRVTFKERDVLDLLTLYGVTDAEERDAIHALVRQSPISGWWQRYAVPLPAALEPYLAMEGRATLIRAFDSQHVPVLLRTPDYARAVFAAGHPEASADETERAVARCAERQRRFLGTAEATLWTVIHESVLRSALAGPTVMRQQVAALLEAAERPSVRLQVVTGNVPSPSPFVVLRFPEDELPDVVYIELTTGALYLDAPNEVGAYIAELNRAAIDAESPDRSREFLRRLLEES